MKDNNDIWLSNSWLLLLLIFSDIKNSTQSKETQNYRIFRQIKTYELADMILIFYIWKVSSERLN